MVLLTKLYFQFRESVLRNSRGQTMTEYALIFASIVVVAWSAYSLMGHDIGSITSGIDSSITSG